MSEDATNEDDLNGLDAEDDSKQQLQLTSKDSVKVVKIDKKYAFLSVLIKTSIENDQSATDVPLPGVEGPILEEVVKYMERHKGVPPPIIEKPLRSKVMKDVCKDSWDAEYIDRIGENRQELYDLILAANYMDITSLLHLGCAKVASLIKGQPLERIKDILSTGTKSDDKAKKTSSDEKKDT